VAGSQGESAARGGMSEVSERSASDALDIAHGKGHSRPLNILKRSKNLEVRRGKKREGRTRIALELRA